MQFGPPKIAAEGQTVIARAEGQIISQLISIVDTLLREVEDVDADRTKAGNFYLTHWPQDVLGSEIEKAIVEDRV